MQPTFSHFLALRNGLRTTCCLGLSKCRTASHLCEQAGDIYYILVYDIICVNILVSGKHCVYKYHMDLHWLKEKLRLSRGCCRLP